MGSFNGFVIYEHWRDNDGIDLKLEISRGLSLKKIGSRFSEILHRLFVKCATYNLNRMQKSQCSFKQLYLDFVLVITIIIDWNCNL